MRNRMLLAALATMVSVHDAGAQSNVRQLRLTETLRIDGAKEDISGQGLNVTVDARGRMVIFNVPTFQFLFFDSTGRRLGTFGAKGAGPGEFESRVSTGPAGAALASIYMLRTGIVDDTLWVYASESRRFTLITPDLKLGRIFTLPQRDAATILSFTPLAVLSADRILGRATFGERVPTTAQDGRTVTTTKYSDSAFIVMSPDGSVERRVVNVPPNNGMAVYNPPGGRYMFAPVPFAGAPLVSASANGDRLAIATAAITSANGGAYRLTVIRANGDTAFSRSHPYTAPPVTKAMSDSAMALRERVYAAQAGGLELMRIMRERVPAVLPPFNGIDMGSDGTVWLRRNLLGSPPAEFVVFTPTGDILGAATFPRKGLSIQTATRSTVWATETDADGFVSIVRFRVDQQ